jgi:enamine deaminase RidA (YjgF/YER057c/UK114 family)
MWLLRWRMSPRCRSAPATSKASCAACHAPARATVQAALAKPQWKVEIVVTAALP